MQLDIIILIEIESEEITQQQRILKIKNDLLRHLEHDLLDEISLLKGDPREEFDESVLVLSLSLLLNKLDNLAILYFLFALFGLIQVILWSILDLDDGSLDLFLIIKDSKICEDGIQGLPLEI